MKKSFFALSALVLAGLSMTACGISEFKPEPVPLAVTDSAHFKLDHSAIPSQLSVCGEKVKEFQNTLRNGFNYAANSGDNASVVSADKAEMQLALRKIDMTCIGKDKVKGFVITANIEYSWKQEKGPETIWNATIVSGSEKSAEKALDGLVVDMYNTAFNTYLTQIAK